MQFRHATLYDAPRIAALHALSWQKTYRGILRDEYLNAEVLRDRLAVWRQRLTKPVEKQWVWLATDGSKLLGFVCVIGDHDPDWGSLIDNLHIHPDVKGRGLGASLMREAAEWMKENCAIQRFYLWVYEDNLPARQFYEKLGGINSSLEVHENPGGGSANVLRYSWKNLV